MTAGETMGRRLDFQQLSLLEQTVLYNLFITSFLGDTFEEQVGAVLSLTVGMCGCVFESPEQGAAAVGRATRSAIAVLLEHGRLLQPEEIMEKLRTEGPPS